MRLKHFVNIRRHIPYNGTRKQHSARFSSDKSGAYHMTSHIKIILRLKVLFYHKSHLLITRHHYLAHDIAGLIHVHPALILELRRVKKLIPEINVLILAGALEIFKKLIETTALHTVQNRPEISVLLPVNMRKKHGLGIAVPYLLGAHIHIFCIGIHIKKKLCCIKNLVYGIK